MQAAGTDTGGKVHEAVAKYAEVRIRRERSAEVLLASARPPYVRRRDTINASGAVRKMLEHRLRCKHSQRVVKASGARIDKTPVRN